MSNSSPEESARPPGSDTEILPRSPANFSLSQEPVTAGKPAAAATGSDAAGAGTQAPAYEHLGELPANYGKQAVYLVAYDPRRLYTYWDLDWSKLPAGSGESLALRVVRADSGEEETRAEIARSDTGKYLPAQQAGGTYFVELGSGGGAGSSRPWRPLAVSGHVTMPPESVAADDDGAGTEFATLPYHVSFQRLTDMLREAMAAGEHLTGAIARLQRAGSGLRNPAAESMTSALASLSGEERRNLATLFGWNPEQHGVSSDGGSPGSGQGGLAGLAGGSEALSSAALLGGAAGPSSLSSAALSSAGLLRQLAALGAGGSEARELFSAALFTAAGGGASGGGGSEQLSSGATLRPGPSSERWRFGAAAGGRVAPGGKDSEAFVRERAERFIRSITSSLDSLGSAFRAAGAGASETSAGHGKW